jgi:hypothetical protein
MNELKANPLRPKEVKDPEFRKDLAVEICDMIEQGVMAREGLKKRWDACEKAYRGQPDEQGIKVSEDAEPYAINIVKPRVDALVTKTCGPITAQKPYFSAYGYAQDRNRIKPNEEVVQFMFERANFQRKYREGTRMSCMAAPAVFKVPFSIELSSVLAGQSEDSQDLGEPFKYVGPQIQTIHPNDFVCYPVSGMGVTRARLVGDRISRRCKEVKELQQLGVYFDTDTLYGGDDPQSWASGRDPSWSLTSEASGIQDPDDQMVEMWDVIVKKDLNGDGFEERYRAVVAMTSKVLLEFERYGAMQEEPLTDDMGMPMLDETGVPLTSTKFTPYSRPNYFPHSVVMPGYGELYHANPIAHDLMTAQGAYSDGMTLCIEGGKMSAFPAGFVKGGGKVPTPVKRYRPGEYHYLEGDMEIQFVDPKFNPTVWPLLFQLLKADADALVRISQNGTAQSTGKTASESVIVNNNMEEGADEYRDIAAMAPEEMCDFFRELAFIHYGTMKEAYGESFPCEDRELLRTPLRWEATGKTSDTNPQIIGQNIQEILALFQNPIALQALALSGINITALLKAWLKTKRWPVADSDLFPNEQQPFNQQASDVPIQPGMGQGGGLPPVSGGPAPTDVPNPGSGTFPVPGSGLP